jgi:hypothetical protein
LKSFTIIGDFEMLHEISNPVAVCHEDSLLCELLPYYLWWWLQSEDVYYSRRKKVGCTLLGAWRSGACSCSLTAHSTCTLCNVVLGGEHSCPLCVWVSSDYALAVSVGDEDTQGPSLSQPVSTLLGPQVTVVGHSAWSALHEYQKTSFKNRRQTKREPGLVFSLLFFALHIGKVFVCAKGMDEYS